MYLDNNKLLLVIMKTKIVSGSLRDSKKTKNKNKTKKNESNILLKTEDFREKENQVFMISVYLLEKI